VEKTLRKFGKGIDKGVNNCHTEYIKSNGLIKTEVKVGSLQGSSNKMNAVIGQTFVTAKSGVSGIVEEIVKNASGSSRIRLTLANGDTRWTTAK